MKMQLDYLSCRLEKLRLDIEAARDRDGGLYLSGGDLVDFVSHPMELNELALAIEHALSRAEWNCRAYFEQLVASNANALEILNLMRPDGTSPGASNIIPFRPRSAPFSSGGDAA